jgi:hypothetical protein
VRGCDRVLKSETMEVKAAKFARREIASVAKFASRGIASAAKFA